MHVAANAAEASVPPIGKVTLERSKLGQKSEEGLPKTSQVSTRLPELLLIHCDK